MFPSSTNEDVCIRYTTKVRMMLFPHSFQARSLGNVFARYQIGTLSSAPIYAIKKLSLNESTYQLSSFAGTLHPERSSPKERVIKNHTQILQRNMIKVLKRDQIEQEDPRHLK